LHICPDINVCLLDAHGLLLVMGNRAAMAVAKRLGSDAAPEPKSAFSTDAKIIALHMQKLFCSGSS